MSNGIKAPHNTVHEDLIESINSRNRKIALLKKHISELKEVNQSNFILGLIATLNNQLNDKLMEQLRSKIRIYTRRNFLVDKIDKGATERVVKTLSDYDTYYGLPGLTLPDGITADHFYAIEDESGERVLVLKPEGLEFFNIKNEELGG